MTNSSKRTLFIVSSAIVFVAALVLIVLSLTVWTKPSQQDFKDARAMVTTIDDSYEKIGDASQDYYRAVTAGFMAKKSYDSVAADTADTKDKYINAMEGHNVAVSKLEENKSLKDAEVLRVFEAFVAKDRKYTTNSDGFVYPFARFRSSLENCIDVFDVAKEKIPTLIAKRHKEASQDCLIDLDAVAASKPGALATYGKKFAAIVRERQAIFDQTANEKMSLTESGKRINELGEAYGALDPIGEFNKMTKEVNLASELKALGSVLDRKSSQ